MPYDSTNRKLYIDTSVTPNKGISLNDIATCLRDYRVTVKGRRDLGLLATSPNINRWSKNQPFETLGNPYDVQTEEMRKYSAYGYYWWNVSEEEDAPFALAATYLFEDVLGLTDHNWLKKTITTYRLADFDGYIQNALMPYKYINESDTRDYNKVLKIEEITTPTGTLRVEDFPDVFGSQITNYEICLLYRKRGDTGVNVVSTGYGVGDLLASIPEASFSVPPTLEGNVDVYDYVWAATNEGDSGADRIAWFYFPDGYGTFTYDGYYQVKYMYDTDELSSPFEAINVNGYVVTSATQEVKSLKLVLEAYHNFNYPAEGKLILHVWGREQGWDSGQDYEIEAMDDGYTLFDINVEEAFTDSVTADDALMALSVYVRDEREEIITSPNYTSYHFDFENNTLAFDPAGESDGISIWDMMTIRDDFR